MFSGSVETFVSIQLFSKLGVELGISQCMSVTAGAKGIKVNSFAKNHYSGLLRSKSWKETISNMAS